MPPQHSCRNSGAEGRSDNKPSRPPAGWFVSYRARCFGAARALLSSLYAPMPHLSLASTRYVFLVDGDRSISEANEEKAKDDERDGPAEGICEIFTRDVRDMSNKEKGACDENAAAPQVHRQDEAAEHDREVDELPGERIEHLREGGAKDTGKAEQREHLDEFLVTTVAERVCEEEVACSDHRGEICVEVAVPVVRAIHDRLHEEVDECGSVRD